MGKKRIGNTTDSRRETSHLKKFTAMYAEEIESYKLMAENRRKNRIYTQENILEAWQTIKGYFADCQRAKKPMTIAGIILSLKISRDTWDRWRKGEYDYLLEEYLANTEIDPDDVEEIDGIPVHKGVALITRRDLCEMAYLTIQNQLEMNLYTNRGNPAGSIFSLKHNYKWREDDAPNTVNQTLVLADVEQARKALSMLKEEE